MTMKKKPTTNSTTIKLITTKVTPLKKNNNIKKKNDKMKKKQKQVKSSKLLDRSKPSLKELMKMNMPPTISTAGCDVQQQQHTTTEWDNVIQNCSKFLPSPESTAAAIDMFNAADADKSGSDPSSAHEQDDKNSLDPFIADSLPIEDNQSDLIPTFMTDIDMDEAATLLFENNSNGTSSSTTTTTTETSGTTSTDSELNWEDIDELEPLNGSNVLDNPKHELFVLYTLNGLFDD